MKCAKKKITGIFLGKHYRILFELIYVLAQTATLWSYFVVFGASLTMFSGIPGILKNT